MATHLPDPKSNAHWLMVHYPGEHARAWVEWYERSKDTSPENMLTPCSPRLGLPAFALVEAPEKSSAKPLAVFDWPEKFGNVEVVRGGSVAKGYHGRHSATYLIALRTSGAQDGQPLSSVATLVNIATADLSHDGFGAGWSPDGPKEWPTSYWRCICYAVEGTSEGHYIHVDALLPQNVRQPLLQGKTFGGANEALALVARISFVLGLV